MSSAAVIEKLFDDVVWSYKYDQNNFYLHDSKKFFIGNLYYSVGGGYWVFSPSKRFVKKHYTIEAVRHGVLENIFLERYGFYDIHIQIGYDLTDFDFKLTYEPQR